MLLDVKEFTMCVYVYNVYQLRDGQSKIETIPTMKSDDIGDYISPKMPFLQVLPTAGSVGVFCSCSKAL